MVIVHFMLFSLLNKWLMTIHASSGWWMGQEIEDEAGIVPRCTFRKSVGGKIIISISGLKVTSDLDQSGDTKELTWDP
jgi:hypothetical protein